MTARSHPDQGWGHRRGRHPGRLPPQVGTRDQLGPSVVHRTLVTSRATSGARPGPYQLGNDDRSSPARQGVSSWPFQGSPYGMNSR
jgi:hypothetical protein